MKSINRGKESLILADHRVSTKLSVLSIGIFLLKVAFQCLSIRIITIHKVIIPSITLAEDEEKNVINQK